MQIDYTYVIDELNESVLFHTRQIFSILEASIGTGVIDLKTKMEVKSLVRAAVVSGWRQSATTLYNSTKTISNGLIEKQFKEAKTNQP